MVSEIVSRTAVGQQRDHNEDSVLAESLGEGALLAVADGMGGHAAGDVASQLAVDTLREELLEGRDSMPPKEAWDSLLETAISNANQAINEEAAADQAQSGMGTTLVAALVEDGTAVIGNVGDSRAYALAAGDLEQVTTDQSLVQELVEQGQITAEEAETHPQRNVVSQALGTDEEVDPDFYEVEVSETLLLCSDGLSEEVTDEGIEAVVADASTTSAAGERLVERANENGGSDNISVVLGHA